MSAALILLVFGGLILLTFLHNAVAFLTPFLWLAIYIFIFWRGGKAIDKRRNTGKFKFIFPVVALVLPSFWFYAGFNAFDKLCTESKEIQVIRHSQVPQKGFLYDFTSLSKSKLDVPEELIESGQFAYYELPPQHCTGCSAVKVTRVASPVGWHTKRERIESIESKYHFVSEPVQEIASWWLPSIYKIRYLVADLSSKEVLAEGVEHVFGGGVIGVYIHAALGERGDYYDRDFSFLGCGYASKKPVAWRPRFSTNPSNSLYERADKQMLTSLQARDKGPN